MASKLSVGATDARARDAVRAGMGGLATRTVVPGLAAVAVAGLLAACGSNGGSAGAGGGSGSGASASQAHQAPPSRGVVSARTLPGVGTVLVNRAGKTLYSAQQEAHGKIMCTGSCLSFWSPVPATAGAALRAPGGVAGALGTVHRPDGVTQLTYHGKPLYTFKLDRGPGQAQGNNFTDSFGGTSFTWHAATTSGSPAGTGRPGNGGGYAYQSSSPGY
jgi:predicted lipoprotein with Yx(FWY)xxD motif